MLITQIITLYNEESSDCGIISYISNIIMHMYREMLVELVNVKHNSVYVVKGLM